MYISYKMHCASLLYNLKRSSETEIDLRSSFGYQLTDCAVSLFHHNLLNKCYFTQLQMNSIGSLLAVSCAKEVRSNGNPVCYKRALVVKVISTNNDGRELRLEEVNVPLGVIKASSLQVSFNYITCHPAYV